MGMKTVTRWACDKCKVASSEQGEAAIPPEGWATLVMTVRLPAPAGVMAGYSLLMGNMQEPGTEDTIHVDEAGDITVSQTETKHYCEECWDDISLNL